MEVRETAIAWIDLSFKSQQFEFSKQFCKEKIILNKLNGSVEFGTINALMGPSGAGKTTLLKCLNGKLSSGMDMESRIYVNVNHKIKPCFVVQHSKEHLIMCLTAKQNLIYASKLKNSKHKKSNIDHIVNIQGIMQELLIEDIAETEVQRCSGGEQKRLTIAVEMTKLRKPNLLCIDEPTTGLDSNAAETVMECLRKLAKSHRMSIITSIHQPNHEIVVMFDKIYVLAKGGNCVFSGAPDLILSHLNDCNIIINENQFPIEQLLKFASIETQEEYFNGLIQRTRQILRQEVLEDVTNKMKLSPTGLKSRSKTFSPFDMWYIMMRTMAQQYIKQWKALLFQLFYYISFAFCITSMFDSNISRPSACFNPHTLSNSSCVKDLENNTLLIQNQNFLFFSAIIVQFLHLCYTTTILLTDVKIFINEHDNHWYSTGSYLLAKNITELITSVTFPAMYAFLIFYWSGQPMDEERVWGFVLIMVLGFLCTEGIGHNIGISLVNLPNIAIFISIAIFAVLVLYCNYFIQTRDLPVFFQHLSDLAHPKYMFNSAIILVYGLDRCSSQEESVMFLKYDVKDDELHPNYYKLAGLAVILRIMAFIMLYLKTNLTFNVKTCKKQNTKPDETIEMNSNTTVVDLKGSKKRLSLILSEIQLGIEENNNERDFIRSDGSNESQIIIENPKKQIIFAWKDMTLRITKSFFGKEKVILKQINGFFEFGTINALMGCSGAGKTSLLKAINGLYGDYITDDSTILLNKNRRIRTCYIVQDEREHILTGLTAGQSMTYASKLKNSDPLFDHMKNIKTLMKELLISNTFNTSVENCSGGEQKRLVIAMELTSSIKPNLICIDEPTSGLDSNAAEVVIKCLKRLSENHNICVITSIHQPNNEILMLFDKLYVMAKGGQSLYSGRPQELSQYLLDCGVLCTRNQVPIEVLLKHSCNGINDSIVQKMIKKTQESEKSIIRSRSKEETTVFLDGINRVSKRFYMRDFLILLMRALTYTYRYKWKLILIEFFLYISFAVTLVQFYGRDIGDPTACINLEDDYNNTCIKTKEKLHEETLIDYNTKFTFYVVIVILFFTIVLTAMTFTSDLKMFFNEQRNGWYSTGAYYWSKSISEMIPLLIHILAYSFLVDIYDRSMFVSYLTLLTIGALEIQSIGHFIGIMFSSNQRMAIFVAVGVLVLSFLFGNFMVQIDDLHYSLRVISNLSPVKLVLESILILYYGFDLCSDREFSFVLYFFGVDDDDFYKNTWLLIVQFILFRTVSLIALFYKVNPLTNSKVRAKEKREVIQNMRKPSKAFIYGLTTESETDIKTCIKSRKSF